MAKKEVIKPKKKKRRWVYAFLFIFLLLAAAVCSLLYYEFYIRSPLCGIWQRVLDDAAGTQVDLYRRDDRYYAVIVRAEGIMKEKGFAADDLLWRDIKEIDIAKYQGQELISSYFGFNYEHFFLTMTDYGKLEAEPASGGVFIGTSQTWKKLNSNIIINLMRLAGLEDSFPREKAKKQPELKPNIVFTNNPSWKGWEGLDYTIDEEGSVIIYRNRHLAPNIHYDFNYDQVDSLRNNVIFTTNTRLTGFINNTYTLLTVFTDSDNISLVTDKTGRIGILSGPDGSPDYSDPGVFSKETHDISLFFNVRDSQIAALVDGKPVIIIERYFPFHPIQSVWLGVVWIGGSNNFGPPINHTINSFEMGFFE